ncbi:MAG TPA: sensor histidine kinase [Rhizomicrobium sp.]
MSVLQGVERAQRDSAAIREQLISDARLAVAPEENVLAAADHVAHVLATLPAVRDTAAQCNGDLAAARNGFSFFSNIARTNARGTVVCSALPRSLGFDASRLRSWRAAQHLTDFDVTGETVSAITGQPIILGMLPLRDGQGHFDGTLNIGISVRWIDDLVRSSHLSRSCVMALFDRTGKIIASNDPKRAAILYQGVLPGTAPRLASAGDSAGNTWIYATAALLGKNVFVGFAVKQSSAFRPTYIHVATDFVTPLLMLALTWVATWIATEQQVTRWILYLERIAAAYKAGHYSLRPSLTRASSEFQILGQALAAMAEAIQERDRSLRDAVAQKSLLIKEIHHRVKNNLQIVMSLLSLQAGRLRDPAAQEALRQSRARINALALVHRILYEIEDQQIVGLKPLLEQLMEQTREGFGAERRDIATEVSSVSIAVPGDVAVPIALLVIEALTNAYKHAFPFERGGTIRLTLEYASEERLHLSVVDDGIGMADAEAEASIGARLIATFGQQLGGTARTRNSPQGGTCVEVEFAVPSRTTTM